MNCVHVLPVIILALFIQLTESPRPAAWHNFMPWSRDMPESEYKKHINVILISKDWNPKVKWMPDNTDEILAEYPGHWQDAYLEFRDISNDYAGTPKLLENAVDLLHKDYGYDPTLESVFVIHTLSGNAKNWMIRNIVLAMAMRNMVKHFNIFTLDMPGLEGSIEQTVVKSFFGLKTNYRALGGKIAQFLNSAIEKDLIKLNQINLVGFCWSAQLSGYIARHVKEKNNGVIKSILALDPHSFGVSLLFHRVLLASDAEAVHAYHTNSLLFGTLRQKSTVDFVFNGGLWQPGCYMTLNVMCSHRRAVTLLWYSILYPKMFVARKCGNWFAFKFCRCNNEASTTLTFPPKPGFLKGTFFIDTLSHKPYGLGAAGSICSHKRIKKKDQELTNQNKKAEQSRKT